MTVPSIDLLRDVHGNFSMLAIDQRGSLQAMLAAARPASTIDDEAVVTFKLAVSHMLSPSASAILIDRQFGRAAADAAKCPVILAADLLHQGVPGGPVTGAELDEDIDAAIVSDFHASALKMLVPWLPDARDQAIELSARFMALCRTIGLPGIVEGVVRPDDIQLWSDSDRNEALVTAAQDLAGTHPDLYKAEIPSYGTGDPEIITAAAKRITDSLSCPWVVLSSGVTADRFPAAVAACRTGGASGFLAGRAIWADAITAADTDEYLQKTSRQRLEQLTDAA